MADSLWGLSMERRARVWDVQICREAERSLVDTADIKPTTTGVKSLNVCMQFVRSSAPLPTSDRMCAGSMRTSLLPVLAAMKDTCIRHNQWSRVIVKSKE